VGPRAARAARSSWLRGLAKAGLFARALLQTAVGLLAVALALGERVATADKQGALETVAAQPFGSIAVAAIGAGLFGYSAWRLVMAFVGPASGKPFERRAKRAGYLLRGLLYAAFGWAALRLATGLHGEDRLEEVDATAALLRLPLGRFLVGLVGAGFFGAAAWAASRVITGSAKKRLDLASMSAPERRVALWTSSLGHASRTVVWALVGLFLVRAALFADPHETVGLDGALRAVVSAPLGRGLLLCVAGGLLAQAAFGLLEARYRRVRT
jgi:hypothetical protein